MTYRELQECLAMLDRADGRYSLQSAHWSQPFHIDHLAPQTWCLLLADERTLRVWTRDGTDGSAQDMEWSVCLYVDHAAFMCDWPELRISHQLDTYTFADDDAENDIMLPSVYWPEVMDLLRVAEDYYPRWRVTLVSQSAPRKPYYQIFMRGPDGQTRLVTSMGDLK